MKRRRHHSAVSIPPREFLPGTRFSQLGTHLPPLIFSVPAPVPAFPAPVPAVPAGELRSVNRAALAKLKHARPSVWPPSIDAKHLDLPRVRVHTKRAVSHTESTIRVRKLS